MKKTRSMSWAQREILKTIPMGKWVSCPVVARNQDIRGLIKRGYIEHRTRAKGVGVLNEWITMGQIRKIRPYPEEPTG